MKRYSNIACKLTPKLLCRELSVLTAYPSECIYDTLYMSACLMIAERKFITYRSNNQTIGLQVYGDQSNTRPVSELDD